MLNVSNMGVRRAVSFIIIAVMAVTSFAVIGFSDQAYAASKKRPKVYIVGKKWVESYYYEDVKGVRKALRNKEYDKFAARVYLKVKKMPKGMKHVQVKYRVKQSGKWSKWHYFDESVIQKGKYKGYVDGVGVSATYKKKSGSAFKIQIKVKPIKVRKDTVVKYGKWSKAETVNVPNIRRVIGRNGHLIVNWFGLPKAGWWFYICTT